MVRAGEIRAVLIVDRVNRKHVVGKDVIGCIRSAVIRQVARCSQTETKFVLKSALLNLETEAMTFHIVVASYTLSIEISVGSTIIAMSCAT